MSNGLRYFAESQQCRAVRSLNMNVADLNEKDFHYLVTVVLQLVPPFVNAGFALHDRAFPVMRRFEREPPRGRDSRI